MIHTNNIQGLIKEIKQAQEFIDSRALINVNDHGIPVFIQKLHMDHHTATVFPLDEMDREQIVELDGLTDEGT